MCIVLKSDTSFHQRVRLHPLHHRQRPGLPPDEPKNPINVSFLHGDFMCNRKFSIVLGLQARGLGQRECPRPQREECRKDGLKSKYAEKVRVQKGEWKLRHVLMVGARLIPFTGIFTVRLYKAPGDLNDFSFISDIINETLRECGVWTFSFNRNKHDIVHHDGETMSVRSTLTDNSHIYTLTYMLLHQVPDIHSDHNNIIIVYPTRSLL